MNNYTERIKVTKNVDTLCKYVISIGGEQFSQSVGSSYFKMKNGQTIRISDHASGGYGTLMYDDTDVNIVVRPCDELFYYLKKYFQF